MNNMNLMPSSRDAVVASLSVTMGWSTAVCETCPPRNPTPKLQRVNHPWSLTDTAAPPYA